MMLAGKRIIVTGGAHGIGRAIVRRCVAEGAQVAIFDLDAKAAEEVLRASATEGGQPSRADNGRVEALAFAVNLRDPEAIREAMGAVQGVWSDLDGIVNNAAIRVSGKLQDLTVSDWTDALFVNVRGAALVVQFALPLLRRSPRPSVVNIGSSVVDNPIPDLAPYTMSKAALHGLSRALAVECARDGIRVNCVSPGTVSTRWVAQLVEQAPDPARLRARLEARHLLARLGTPEDVAAVTAFLLSDESAFVTGACYRVDGGYSINGGFLAKAATE